MQKKIAENDKRSIKELKKEPNQQLIGYLTDMLGDAKTGKLQGCAGICYWNDNTTTNGWSGLNKNTRLIMGELVILQQLIADSYVQQEKENLGE